MSNLTAMEKRKIERAFNMSSGYVLNFTNRTFSEFFLDSVGLDIYNTKYDYGSGSKANRMRAFWEIESNYMVGKLLGDIFDNWNELSDHYDQTQTPDDCLRIVHRLKESATVSDIEAVRPISDEKGFEALAKSVREAIDRDEPETGLDRLHTFLVKYFRVLCRKHEISIERKKPLHSLVGEYVKALKKEGLIESKMTERILKSSISVMEAFSKVRNEQSYAHDNKVLNYHESLLIFSHVTSSIRFIEALESNATVAENKLHEEYNDIPF